MKVSDADLDRAARILRSGGLVAFPTETVYGLGANALDRAAVRSIFRVKGRPSTSPLIVHVADFDAVTNVAAGWPEAAAKLAERFWPGPLTLVVRRHPTIPDEVTAALDTVGIRMPAHPVALELIRRAGVPVAAPSANRFTQISPTTAEHVRAALGQSLDMILDGGPSQVGIESTVVAVTEDQVTLLRPGMISAAQIEAIIGTIETATGAAGGNAHASPGLHHRHYAPRTPFYVLGEDETPPDGKGKLIAMPADPEAYAAVLYSSLHAADSEAWDWIAVRQPPRSPEWTAIQDRLKRAAQQ